MEYFAGCDLHSNNTVIGILDEEGKRIYKKRIPNDLNQILNHLKPFKDEIKGVVVESKESVKIKDIKDQVFEGKAISLRILQEKLRNSQSKRSLTKEIFQQVGITKFIGYVVDEPNRDLILIGQCAPALPYIYLDDFIIALRNIWNKYAPLRGNTYYSSYPGCSIDPEPNVLQGLEVLAQDIIGGSYREKIEEGIQKWHSICRSAQKVRVEGIPFDTHFARVMVKADYDMKNLVDGADSLDIPGFKSLMDMTLEIAQENIIRGGSLSIPISSMNRFWFCPGENQYVEDKGVVILKKCQVILLTEEEHLSRRGKVIGKERPNRLAQSFADSFSALYTEVAKQRPIYSELEALFRFVALAKIIKYKSPHKLASLDLGYLFEEHKISATHVSRLLPGRSNVKKFQHRKDFSSGYQLSQLWIPSCGGVGINIQVNERNFIKDTEGVLLKLKENILIARPSSGTLSWNFSLSNFNF